MTTLPITVGRRNNLLQFGVLLLFSGDIGVMLNLYTSDMFAGIWKGFLLSCTVFCVDYVYDGCRPWVKKTVFVALGVLQFGLFVAGYASTSAAGDFFLGVVGVIEGYLTIMYLRLFIRIKHNNLYIYDNVLTHVILFEIQLFLLILYCIGAVVLTGQVTVAGLCLGGFVCGNVYYYLPKYLV